MIRITSLDGTSIACRRSGTGPPLILVPGSGAANPSAWADVIPAFEERFTVYAVDRRGHRQSGDGPAYAIEREFEDVAAIVDALEQPAHLLGHSFGGLCCLEAALRARKLGKLILYEPAVPLPGIPIYPAGFVDRLQAMLDRGDREGVLIALYTEVGKIPPAEMELFTASPAWPERVAAAHTVTREARAEESYRFDPRRFKDLRAPTLLLLGGSSPQSFKEVTHAIAAALPAGRIAVMPGQQHTAMYTAPERFAREVLAFLTAAD